MADSDGPVVAKAVYQSITRILADCPPILENFMKKRSELKDKDMIRAEWDVVSRDMEKAIAEGSHRLLTSLSLADVVDALVRELRNNGVPADQWATFVHIGV